MNFKQLSDLYVASAWYHKLEKATSQKTYLFTLGKLEQLLKGWTFYSSLDENALVAFCISKQIAVAKDVAEIYSRLDSIKGDGAKASARRIFLVVWHYAESIGVVSIGSMSSLPTFRQSETVKGVITQEDIKQGEVKCNKAWLRAYERLARFCFYTGMRPAEAEQLVWGDVKRDYVEVRNAKGRNKGQVARLCKRTHEVNMALPDRPRNADDLVFVSFEGKPLNKDMRSRASQYLYGKEFYSTRRGTATAMYNAGYGILQIRDQLGHKDVKTTQLYINPTMEDKANSFKGF